MANFIEKRLPKSVRNRFKTLVGTGLGLFLALRYNDFIRNILTKILPDIDGLFIELLFLVILTFGVVYFTLFIEKLLDGR